MTSFDIKTTLCRLHAILEHHSGDSASWISDLISLSGTDETALYASLNSKCMWGGAGSIANESLADNPGLDEWAWQMEIREFRETMIELGTHLMSRGNEYPDISSWIMAFSNWNQSEI